MTATAQSGLIPSEAVVNMTNCSRRAGLRER